MYKSKGELKTGDLETLGEVRLLSPDELRPSLSESESEPHLQQKKRRRQHHFIFIACAILLIVVGVGGGIYFGQWEGGNIAVDELTALKIKLNVNNESREILTNSVTVGEMLAEQHIRLTEDDYLGVPLDLELYDGMNIWLRLAVDITVKADGKEYTLTSQPITVQNALSQCGITLSKLDKVSLPLLSYIYTDSTIEVSRVWVTTENVDEAIPSPTVEREYTYLTPGSSEIVNEGVPGIQRSVYNVTYCDGVEISRTLLSSSVAREPTNTIVGVGPATVQVSAGGTELPTATTASGASFYYTSCYMVETTAYTWTGNRTATGTWPAVGTIAVDPSRIPLGTEVYIVGYGFAKAEDTGGAIKGNIVDLYMDTESECINWGRRNVTIYILAK